MSNNGEFSEEQSEDLISHLNSSGRTEFEQLRSALNLLAHVSELPPTSVPPVLPSGITQPIPLIPVKSTKPRRTVVTSVIVVGILTSASLAAAAVTGIGPTPIVNIGHQTAKFVKGVAGAVSHVVTGGNAETAESGSATPQIPGLTPAPTSGEDSSSNNNEGSGDESLGVTLPLIPSVLTPEARRSSEGKGGSGKEGKTNSNESQSSGSDDSSSLTLTLPPSPLLSPGGEKEHSDGEGQKAPESSQTTRSPTASPSPNPSDQSSDDE